MEKRTLDCPICRTTGGVAELWGFCTSCFSLPSRNSSLAAIKVPYVCDALALNSNFELEFELNLQTNSKSDCKSNDNKSNVKCSAKLDDKDHDKLQHNSVNANVGNKDDDLETKDTSVLDNSNMEEFLNDEVLELMEIIDDGDSLGDFNLEEFAFDEGLELVDDEFEIMDVDPVLLVLKLKADGA